MASPIKGRALAGLARLFGTTGAQNPSPLQVDTDVPLTLVHDVGPGAHSRSPWLREGYAALRVLQVHAGAGTLQFDADPWDFIDAAGAQAYDAPVRDPTTTTLWVVGNNVLVDASGTTANFTASSLMARQRALLGNTALTINNADYTATLDFCGSTTGFNLSGGSAGLRLCRRSNDINLFLQAGKAWPMEPGDSLAWSSQVSGALTVIHTTMIWVGADGAPPPNYGF